jgi:hypothetical protein
MAGINTKLDANQVIKQAYDEDNQRLRVDASISASIGDVSIVDSNGNELDVNADGSINVNLNGGSLQIEVSAADGDNVAISDGTNTVVVNPDGSLNTNITGSVSVTATDLDIRNLTYATDKVDVTGSSVTVSATDLDIRNLSATQDSVSISDGTNALSVNVDGSINEANSANILSELQSIDNKLPALGPQTQANSISVTLSSNEPALNVELDAFTGTTPDNVQMVGSVDGTKTGQKYGFVNNIKQMVLASADRVRNVYYLDVNSRKNRRVDKFIYTSSTFPGYSVVRQFNYTLVNNEYVFTNDSWTII